MGYYRVIMAAGAEVYGFRGKIPPREVVMPDSAPAQDTPSGRRKLIFPGGKPGIALAATVLIDLPLEIARGKGWWHGPTISSLAEQAIIFMGGHGGSPSPEQQKNVVDSYCEVHNLGPDCTSR